MKKINPGIVALAVVPCAFAANVWLDQSGILSRLAIFGSLFVWASFFIKYGGTLGSKRRQLFWAVLHFPVVMGSLLILSSGLSSIVRFASLAAVAFLLLILGIAYRDPSTTDNGAADSRDHGRSL